MIVTIDGPAGTGKTTVAQKVAQELNFEYFDTGAMYRTLTFFALRKGLGSDQEEELVHALKDFKFFFQTKKDGKHYFLGSEDVTKEIRSDEVTKWVSLYAALPQVRLQLVHIQKEFASRGNVVFEGRDMGTVVFPNAECKIFLNASLKVRSERRFFQEHQKKPTVEEVNKMTQLIEARDVMDQERKHSPLKKAHDAIEIDTSHLTSEQVVSKIIQLIKKHV